MSKPTDKPSTSSKGKSVEEQNDIYRNLFAQAGMRFPEAKQLGNFKIPKLKCPEQIRLSNEKYEWARRVVDYRREPEPKLSYGRPAGWRPPNQQQQPRFPPPFQQVPRFPSPQTTHFGGSSVSGTGTDCEFSRGKKFANKVAPDQTPTQRWTRSATQRYKDYSYGSVVSNSSSSSGASSIASFTSVSTTGAVCSPKSTGSGSTVYVNPNFVAGQPAKHAKKKGKTSSTPSPATSTTSCSSTGSSDTEIFNYSPKSPPPEDYPNVEGSLDFEKIPESVEGAVALPLIKTEIPEEPSSSSGYNSNGNGYTGRRGSPLIRKDSPIDLDAIQIADDESDVHEDDQDDDDDDDDILVIGLSKKERKEVESWNKILKKRERKKH